MEIQYSDRSLLSVQQREDDQRRQEAVRSVMEGFADSGCDDGEKEEIHRRLSFVYEDSGRNQLKTKYTVSGLAAQQRGQADIIDTAVDDWRQAFDQRPAFLEAKQLTAADRGTAYHRVMECISFRRSWTAEEVREFIGQMVERELISQEEAKLIRSERISAFFQSPLGKRLIEAQKIQKEASFNLKTEKDGHAVTVQGTIDCYFAEEDGVVLLDYKSNFVDESKGDGDIQRLVRWYRPQLQMYRQALEEISGYRVKEMYLYLFSAKKAVRISMEEEERNHYDTAEE